MSIHLSKLNRPEKGTLTLFSQHISNIIVYLACFYAIINLYSFKYEIPLPHIIRVAAVDIERNFPKLSPWGPGFDREILDEFGNYTDVKLLITPYPTHNKAFEALQKGKADLMLASGYNPENFKKFTSIKAGPVYEQSPALLLHNIRRFELRTPFELCDQTIFAPKHSGLIKTFKDLSDYLVCAPTLITSNDSNHLDPLLELNEDKNFRFHLVEAGAFKPLQPFLHKLRVTDNFGDDLEYRWYWRDDIQGLTEVTEDYWHLISTNGTLENKREIYFGFLPDETDFYDLYSLRKDIREKLPFYRKYILKAAKKYNIDPLLLAAVMYQESRFDPLARSKTGVRGLMQLTENTADLMGLTSRLDPEQSITGGAKYLRFLWDKLSSRDVDGWNRWLFTLAAYNQGLGHVYDAIEISGYLGKSSGTWRSLKQIFPLLTMPKYHSQTRYGYTRGYEGVDYVDSIRYYYYTMKGLAILPGLEAEYLAPFTVASPAVGP
ncbi:transglycosylase SLT domain-containing protein [Maridesulfovibrio ferrireducens]|uniref:transglycosylase SLT domain-containing protein n=1 Tax=Maridesulfovibrio ferrireducens TaxID=246191 RepID=UPI0026EDE4BD|nr:transglycosylase SLT domain-containing protein [Maridesulfovibrio ferrireducens]